MSRDLKQVLIIWGLALIAVGIFWLYTTSSIDSRIINDQKAELNQKGVSYAN